jgi:hypothetical protein
MYLLTAALVIGGWVVVLITLRHDLARRCEALHLEFQRQVDLLSARVAAVEQDARSTAVKLERSSASAAAAGLLSEANGAQPSDEITPETLATITKTIAALLGRKVHVRSVKLLAKRDVGANPWAQNGRAVIQASHNFSQRKRES